MYWVKVGEVIYYYYNLKIAIIELERPLKIGDKISFADDKEMIFKQEITTLQIDRNKVKIANPGSAVDLLVDNHVKIGYGVYALTKPGELLSQAFASH